ncbi:MAG: HAD-IIIC family phosphatase, partial [Desulfobacteraceae bacterium]|nr:HAD-IIIC family phosphatase [Desulfobacteraceae bacterium]
MSLELIDRFENIAREYSDKTGVVYKGKSLTYRELSDFSTSIALHIRKYESETVVLLLEHGLDVVPAMLGALKSGRVYIPLDPSFPNSRIGEILEDSGSRLLLCNTENLELAQMHSTGSSMDIINMDDINIEEKNISYGGISNTDPAYIMYTSGSTGKPKGVVQNYKSICHFVQVLSESLLFSEKDNMALFSSYSHAVGILDILSTLLTGGTLYPYNVKDNLVVDSLISWLRKERITLYHSVPTLFRFIFNDPVDAVDSLRLVILGGEAVTKGDFDLYRKISREKCYFINLFGCSELLISTMHIMNVEMETKDSLVPIGEQVDGVDIQLLDNSENDVAAFNSGEIVYESDFLFSGYWIKDNNIESFQNIDICKTFKSGDLAQMDMNGTISYLGRKDFQIKIRGQRVEPGEIEYKLTTINEIDSAVVVSQNEELVAYVVLSGNCAHDRIRTYLGSVLPDYMIPVQFVELESIPLTPNGKVDRKALPVPDCNYIPEAEYVAPRNELEERLVEIWQDVLKVGKIGIYDNFFSLGGYSLKAAKLLSLISKNLKVDIAMKDIFANPTIESFSRCIRKTVKKEFLHIERLSDSKEYYPVSSAQLRSFILAQKENINTAYNISGSMIIEGELDKERFNRVFQTLVERHESFRTSFHIIEGEIVQKIDPDLLFKVEYNDISASENSDEDLKRTIQGSIREFDLAEAPLLKINLFRLSEDRHLFIHDTHHIISDGFSSGILVNEFIHLYNGGTLSPLRLQYKDYSHWENNMYESGQMEIQRNYWKKMFKTGSPLLTMPLDFTRPEHIDFSGDSFKFSISSERTTKIGKIVREENLTMNIFFYSLYVLLIGKYSGQDDIVVGSITANRNHDDLSGIIGMFANYLPVRNRIDSQMTFHDFLNGTKKRMLDVYGNGNYPFDKIVGEMEKILPVNRNPLFDTMMVFHNEGSESIGASEISNINFKPVHFAQDRSTLDLKLDVFNGLDNGLDCTFEYSTSLFKPETIKGMAVHFNRLLDIVLETPDILLSEIELFSEGEKVGLEGRREASTESGTKVMVCGTFTGEPVGEYMEFWGVRMDTPLDIEFTNYNQVFQQFHDENSGLLINNGINLLLVRFEDWIRDDSGPEAGKVEKLEKFYSEFTGLLQNTTPNGTWFIGLFPPSGHLGFSRLIIDKLTELTGRLEELTGTLGGFYPVDFRGIGDLYNIETVFDPVQDREGHIPFTEEYFAAMGTVIVRGIRSLKNAFKVIALDCDNTLWKGICGEEGATGVKVDGPFARLQEFLVKKHDEGMLLVLNSKNNEDDVWEVFHRNPGMVLRREHIVASRINWDRKSENLASLADELNLGIDSFIFIDDSQAECFEVMSNMPEVLAIHLPEDPSEIPKYLAHVWAFDNLKPLTEEDRKRSEMYLAEKRRKEVVASSGTLDDFIGTLELKVSMNLAEEDEVPRISQLTQRTNQFNLSTRRRSESEITGLIGTEGINVWTIRVCDRFGDYGLTGVVITEKGDDELILDTFLLSCRVLGRKVENLVLAGLKEYCAASGVKMIRADYRKTEKNTPVRIFFDGGDWDVISSIEERITYGLETNQVRGEYGNIDFYYGSHYPVIEISSNHHVSREAKEEKISGKPDNSENRIQNNWNVEMVNENDLVHRNELFPLRFSTGESIKRLPEKKTRLVSTEYFASRNETEEKLVEIWQEVLGIERIGIKDNFFDLGGHSLKATRVVSRISKVFEVETGLQDIFSNTTIENLSKVIGGSSKTEYRQIEILRSQNTYPVSNSQRRLWVLDQFEKDCTAYNMPATFILEGKLHVSAFEQAYSFMVERHESLRTAFVTEDGEPRQKILNNHSFEIKILDLRNSLDVEKEAKILAKKDLQTSFNLETGSLVRFTIIQIEDEKHLLLFNMHHIISDGWSINIFIKEFMITYNSFRDGQTPELSPLRIQYKDYSVWQNNLLDSSGMDIQREYWLEKLSGELPVLDLPADYIRPVSQTFNGNSLGFVLPKDINTGLNDLCRGNKASLFMLLHALVKVLFHRYTGQTDIILGSPIAGRGHEDLENQIGFYVNTLSLRDTIEGDRTFEELLASVKKTCTDAFDHQDYPFDRLVEELDIKRDMSRSPLFDVMVVLQNNETAVVEFDGLNLSPYNTENTISKFDMTYNFSETGEGLFCGIEYNTDIYSADRIKRMAEHLKLLI